MSKHFNTLDFIVVGAAKAGTTALFEYVRTHPEVALPREKETGFFAENELFARGWDWYAENFLGSLPRERTIGDMSPAYMWGTPYAGTPLHAPTTLPPAPQKPGTFEGMIPGRIAETLPRVKLICVLRDPVERAISHHRMSMLWGWERRGLDTAMDELLQQTHLEVSRRWITGTSWYITLGEYGRLLVPYFQLFAREQIHVIFSSDLLVRREHVLKELFSFIDVDPTWVPPNLDVRYREGAATRRIPALDLYRWRQAAAEVRTLKRLWQALPQEHRDRGNRVHGWATFRLDMWNAKRGPSEVDVSPRVRSALERHFEADGLLLASLIDRQPPWLEKWGTTSMRSNESGAVA